ncbi:MAG: DUF4071 domain-containing protein [bacterium]|nr:DUF4071 domain-containing protein [bacterium]
MAKSATATDPSNDKQLTCFVVTGFGTKTDFSTGRVLNLDKTYEQIIQPAFDQVNVNAFRAIDANTAGDIDSIMYHWLYEADIVIADLSTLNANVFYELGVRHAQKPNTTILIAEMVLMRSIPFDLSHFVILAYNHGGDEISGDEQERFVPILGGTLKKILVAEEERLATAPDSLRESDSPIYKTLHGVTPPAYTPTSHIAPPRYIPPDKRDKKAEGEEEEEGESLASIIDAAEKAKRNKEFKESIELFQKAIERQGQEKPDIFLAQRLALVTYKAGEEKDAGGNLDKDKAIDALLEAEEILKKYCAPKTTTDPETLGLSGAINKRLYTLTDDTEYLDRSIDFYERGFYVKQDYYNGINVAFMYTMKANFEENRFQAIVYYGHANMIRKKVADIVQEMVDDEEGFGKMPDSEKQWVYMTQAEAYQGMGREKDAQRLAKVIEKVATDFGMDSFQGQQKKLQDAIDEFNQRVRPEDLSSPAGTAAAEVPPSDSVEAETADLAAIAVETVDAVSQAVETRVATEPAVYGQGAIVVNADIVKGKPIKSVEVNCKIEYV